MGLGKPEYVVQYHLKISSGFQGYSRHCVTLMRLAAVLAAVREEGPRHARPLYWNPIPMDLCLVYPNFHLRLHQLMQLFSRPAAASQLGQFPDMNYTAHL